MTPPILRLIDTKLANLRFNIWRVKRRWELIREQAAWRQLHREAYARYRKAHAGWVKLNMCDPLEGECWMSAIWLRHCQREVWLRREALRVLA